MAVVLLAACKDPNIGPDDPKDPIDDAGYIQFESPAVGQKSSYIHFYAGGYWESTPNQIKYTKDTIHWEITKQIDRNTFQITERLAGEYFGDDAINRQVRYVTMKKDNDKIIFITERATNSHLLGHNDTLELSLGNANEIQHSDWRIAENNSSQPFFGYVNNYKVNGKEYDKLDIYSDFTPTYYDGAGLLFVYNSSYGMVRHYAMNPWVGDVNGFDLIRNNTQSNSLVGTDWKLSSVIYNDGSVKSIEDIVGDNNTSIDNANFTMLFKNDSEVFGVASCNEYGAQYSINNNNINFTDVFSTKVYCTFSDEYRMILNESTTYKTDNKSLVINSSYGDVKSLVYERMSDVSEVFPLEGTKWKLRAVHYPKGEVLPIERILGDNGSNSAFNQFILDFQENGLLSGFSGCNTYGGHYKVEKSNIEIKAGSITEMGCKFSADYDRILNNSINFTADSQRLMIYTSVDGFVALEFYRVR
jgi:heat shock protein HslJ